MPETNCPEDPAAHWSPYICEWSTDRLVFQATSDYVTLKPAAVLITLRVKKTEAQTNETKKTADVTLKPAVLTTLLRPQLSQELSTA